MSRLTLKQTKIEPQAPATDDAANYAQTVDQAAEAATEQDQEQGAPTAETAPQAPEGPVEPRKEGPEGTEATEAPKSPQKAVQRRAATKKAEGAALAKKTATKKTTKQAAAPKAAAEKRKVQPVHVLATNAKEAEKATVYFHPDDYEYLRYETRGGINDTVRVLVALMRHDPRLEARVERLVREAPRGSLARKKKAQS